MNKITLRDISKHLNLSISTVSRALKNHPDISEETKEKVMQLAALMEYEPNAFAISLRTNQSRLFGVIVPEISNFFYHSFIAALEEESRKSGHSLLILQSGNNPAVEAENLKLCRLNRVAGIFVCLSTGSVDMNRFRKIEESGTPVVFFDKVPDTDSCNKVRLADETAATLAAEKIIERRSKRILAIFGDPSLSISQKRKQAFSDALKGETARQLVIVHAQSSNEAFLKTQKELAKKTKPDTLFSMSDEILTGVMKAVQQKRIKVPDQLGIITISNDGFIPRLYDPEITYIETSGRQLGIMAFKRMLEHLEGKRFYRELVVPAQLVNGQSI